MPRGIDGTGKAKPTVTIEWIRGSRCGLIMTAPTRPCYHVSTFSTSYTNRDSLSFGQKGTRLEARLVGAA